MDNYSNRTLGQSYDWRLIFYYLLLVFIGLANIYASIHGSDNNGLFDFSNNSGKQLVWMVGAFVLGGLIIFVINPNLWDSAALFFYLGIIALLIAVIFLGVEVKGSRSWFAFGPVRFQPAEVSKISTSLLLAFLMSRPGFKISKMSNFLTVAAVIGLPMLIIVAESETGSALVYTGFVFVLYREGLSGWLLAMIGVAILLFILTLTQSAYFAILTLGGIIALCNCLNFKKNNLIWLLVSIAVVTLLAFLPDLWEWIQSMLVPAEELEAETASSLIAKIKPVYILLILTGLSLPVIFWAAVRFRNKFARLSVLSFIIGVCLVFSTEHFFYNILKDYQRKRIEVLLGMKEDPMGTGYNVNQSMIAIGSGGLTGKGYLKGTQTAFGFVPEQSTDFIFCTVGEEWGFMGCSLVIILYVLLMLRIIKDAEHSRESFTRIYGYCLASCLFMHLFINIGMTIGLMPVIGIPLPFMSYGGSSLWAFTIMLAIFIALDHQEKKYF